MFRTWLNLLDLMISFSGSHFSVPYRARLAIVGPNGIGKTTLLRILAGEDTASHGQVSQARSLKIGYLPQEATFIDSTHTLWEECLESFADLQKWSKSWLNWKPR